MTGITASVAVVFFIAILAASPIRALALYSVALFMYPQALAFPLGSADFNTARFSILALLLNVVINRRHTEFKWTLLDLFVVLTWFSRLISLYFAEEAGFLERELGTAFGTLLPYLAVRCIVRSKAELVSFLKTIGLIAAPLALLGLYQCLTGHNPLQYVAPYYSFGHARTGELLERSGFHRATGTFVVHIVFGLFFALVAPLLIGLWHQPRIKKNLLLVLIPLALGGIFSSLSSAPLFAITVALGLICCYPFRRFWPAVAIALFACGLFVEVFSNRHFYHVLTLFSFNSRTAYYRIALIEEAFGGGMDGHWLFGWGYVGLESLPEKFPWQHKDMTNIYIAQLARFGLVTLVPFLITNLLYYVRLIQSARFVLTREDGWMLWCIGCGLFGWNVAMLTCGALDQAQNLLFMVIGLCNNAPLIFSREAASLRAAAERAVSPHGAPLTPPAAEKGQLLPERFRRKWNRA